MTELTVKITHSTGIKKTYVCEDVSKVTIQSTGSIAMYHITYKIDGRELTSKFYTDDVDIIYNTNTGEVYYRRF